MRLIAWILSVAALAVALPTEQALRSPIIEPRQETSIQITDDSPPIVIPDVPAGTVLATDPLQGYKAWVSAGLTRVVEEAVWLAETLAVMRGDRDESRGESPAAGNGS